MEFPDFSLTLKNLFFPDRGNPAEDCKKNLLSNIDMTK